MKSVRKWIDNKWTKRVLKATFFYILGAILTLLVVAVFYLNSQPDLQVWHTTQLDEEFTATSDVKTFDAYLALEDRLFAQLNEKIKPNIPPSQDYPANRYSSHSFSSPSSWKTNWNRSFQWPTASPRAGVLLLHGMSDSPYSLRHLGKRLHDDGAWVVGLRLPGHGTIPSGLVYIKREDMIAAVELAARHLREKIGDAPLYIVGYSNGGALAVNYAFQSLNDDSLPRLAGVGLISPAIGVTPAARFATVQAGLGRLLGLEKLAWTSVLPEYDPFKYNSFAVNAGVVVYELTQDIQEAVEEADEGGKLDQLPPILAFQSVLDATVSIEALLEGLFRHLPDKKHELILFDLNRERDFKAFLKKDPKPVLKELADGMRRNFTLSIVGNLSPKTMDVGVVRQVPGEKATRTPLGLAWPEETFSLSHVALPFPDSDPIYGNKASDASRVHLGDLAVRGERGKLRISASDMLRLRHNPFYPYLEKRLVEFILPPKTNKKTPPKETP